MKAIVTGATGALGRSLVRELLRRGDEVVPLSRGVADLEGRRTIAVELASAPWQSLLEGSDVVFHLAAYVHRVPRTEGERAEADAVNHRATAALAAACAKTGAKLVFASTVAVLGKGGAGLSDETPPAPNSDYGRTKLLGEDAVRSAGADGLRHAILRFPLLYGPHGRGNMERMLEAVARGRYWPIGDQDAKKSCLFFDDATMALILASRGAEGTYIVAGAAPVTLGEIHAAAYQALGKRCPSWTCPSRIARAGARFVDAGMRVAGRSSRLSEQIETLTRPAWYDGSRFASATGFAAKTTLASGMRATAQWMIEARKG